MSSIHDKRHPFEAGRVPGICSRCGSERSMGVHERPYEVKTASDFDRAKDDVAFAALSDAALKAARRVQDGQAEATLAPLAAVLEAVRREIVKQPCLCEVNAQGLMRCRRCLLLT